VLAQQNFLSHLYVSNSNAPNEQQKKKRAPETHTQVKSSKFGELNHERLQRGAKLLRPPLFLSSHSCFPNLYPKTIILQLL
jgi:hypothetical protein